MDSYRVLFLIDYFDKNAGASGAMSRIINNDPILEDYMVLATKVGEIPEGFKIKVIDSYTQIIEILNNNHFDFIHYYKANGRFIFPRMIRAIRGSKSNLPIITTVCQQPNIKNLYLTPSEIYYSSLLVFIDRTAYNCPLIKFISDDKKRFTYLGCSEDLIRITQKLISTRKENNGVVFGRGSTANKCHKDFIKIFNSIDIKNKSFIIVGIKDKTKLKVEQNNIEVLGVLSLSKWLEKCNEFDIFLYILPENAHSSIDGTLGHAMLLEKPIVYYGPDAPKERIQHGINGLIASNISEIPTLCEYLVRYPVKAKKMGKIARQTTIECFNFKRTLDNYHSFYSELQDTNHIMTTHIPCTYTFNYCINNWSIIIKSKLIIYRDQIFRYWKKLFNKKHVKKSECGII